MPYRLNYQTNLKLKRLVWGNELVNTLRPRQQGRHFAEKKIKCFLLNENVSIPINISLTFVPNGPVDNIPALVQLMAWCRPGDKPLSETMMLFYWRKYASLGLNEFTHGSLVNVATMIRI